MGGRGRLCILGLHSLYYCLSTSTHAPFAFIRVVILVSRDSAVTSLGCQFYFSNATICFYLGIGLCVSSTTAVTSLYSHLNRARPRKAGGRGACPRLQAGGSNSSKGWPPPPFLDYILENPGEGRGLRKVGSTRESLSRLHCLLPQLLSFPMGHDWRAEWAGQAGSSGSCLTLPNNPPPKGTPPAYHCHQSLLAFGGTHNKET